MNGHRTAEQADHDNAVSALRAAEKRGIGVGMVIAAAIIVDLSDVYAAEILLAAGLTTMADMRAIGAEAYDVRKLRGVLRQIAAFGGQA